MLLTFEEWMDIWWESGHWFERGCKHGQFCMSRFNDIGNYVRGNVEIILCSENLAQNSAALKEAWAQGRDKRLDVMRGANYKSKMSTSLKESFATLEGRSKVIASHNTNEYRLKQRLAKLSPCTVDEITIFPTRSDLIKALGQGRSGSRSPSFRRLEGAEREQWILLNVDKITVND